MLYRALCGILISVIASVTLNPALDKTVYIDRLLPHDANRIRKIEVDAGGKGVNASRVLNELGSPTVALGFVGGKTGSYIEHVLASEGVKTDFVRTAAETRTNICIQELADTPPTMLNEPGPNVTDEELEKLIAKVYEYASKSSMMIFGGSLATSVPEDIYRTLIAGISELGAKAILDSDGRPMLLGMEAQPFMIKPNRDEVKRLLGVDVKDFKDAVPAIDQLADKGIDVIVISMGSKGAVAGSAEGVWSAIPPKVKPISTIGSGDSMVAGIAHILSQGGSLDEALRWGTAAGAATAMTDGTEICKYHQVISLLDSVIIERLR
ncbi:MAG: 1-phosphofructokinase [Armatimonadota bacterium]|nr:1-phosphofructokinase [Armatimonadota bacterium]